MPSACRQADGAASSLSECLLRICLMRGGGPTIPVLPPDNASGVGNSDADRRRSGNSVLKRLSRDQKLTVIPMVFINFRGDTPCRFSASGSAPAFTSFEINV